ncbi:MAG: hypothetical protein E7Z75_04990 [Methanobrevibacter olleyae]|uniref:Uncharacterized protein n=1 Tax=Methanobrevibacter olleyae TaxID=294671 RepID=A0A8T3VT69_METOL|nr:hypothetical protein [Methanobrevibacter olleyae]
MIGDDDFFMQNADYHYGASDTEKMYGRNYNDSSDYVGGYIPISYGKYESTAKESSENNSYEKYESAAQESSENDSEEKYCIAGILIVLAILLIPTVLVPAITDSMSNSVIVDDLKITRYIHSVQYESKVSTDKGYEITYNQKSFGTHAINVILYSKNGEVLYNDSKYVGTCYLGDVPYIVYLDEKADYAIFEVYRNHLDSGKCIYSERVDVDNVNVKKEFINYDTLYN